MFMPDSIAEAVEKIRSELKQLQKDLTEIEAALMHVVKHNEIEAILRRENGEHTCTKPTQ